MHYDECEFRCDECDFRAVKEKNLVQHVTKVHSKTMRRSRPADDEGKQCLFVCCENEGPRQDLEEDMAHLGYM
jgi:uncharacterized C2H2 Zn-finger protein